MTWTDHLADLDATAFAHLSDDTAARLMRDNAVLATLPAMLDRVDRTDTRHGLATIETVTVVRLSVAALEVAAPGCLPAAGDVVVINGASCVLHGQPWRDGEIGGRDWLCPVTERS